MAVDPKPLQRPIVPASEHQDHDAPRPRLVVSQEGEVNPSPKAEAAPNVAKPPVNPSGRMEMLERLLSFENALRGIKSVRELKFFLANETLHITNAKQIFVLSVHRGFRHRLSIDAISNLAKIDGNAPAIIGLQKQFAQAVERAQLNYSEGSPLVLEFDVVMPSSGDEGGWRQEKSALLVFHDSRGTPIAGMVLVGNAAGFEKDRAVLKRTALAVQHAWRALVPKPARNLSFGAKRIGAFALALCIALLMFVPVSLTALAPVEIVAKDPEIIAAPIDGIIDKVLVEENGFVEKDTPILRFVDTELSANLKIAKQKLAVASAHLQTARQNSFGSGEGRRDLATMQADMDLALAEFNFAEAQYAKVVVRAPRSGMLILNRSAEWQGRPVSVGERIMQFADIGNVEARIDLAVSDAIVINKNAPVQLFLDTDPLNAIEAKVASASYRAQLDAANNLAFSLFADIAKGADKLPRIGARGTAQIYGEKVSLGFYLFRRPLAAIRQWVGW